MNGVKTAFYLAAIAFNSCFYPSALITVTDPNDASSTVTNVITVIA